jgi:hypothetical protein
MSGAKYTVCDGGAFRCAHAYCGFDVAWLIVSCDHARSEIPQENRVSHDHAAPTAPENAGYVRPLAAFCLSCIVHLLVLILGVLLLRGQLPGGLEPERPAGIVLASLPGVASETEYFDESAASETSSSTAPSAAHTPSAALPAGDSPPPAVDIELPGSLPAIEGVAPGVASAEGGRTGPAILDPTAGMVDILAAEAKRPRAKGPSGPQGEVSIFGSGTTHGHSFVFVIDRSQSMGSQGLNAIAAAEVELLSALSKLQSNHSFQVVAYNQSPAYFAERKLVPVSDDSLAACRLFLQNLAAFGATDHERAIMSALQLKPDVLYLLTDGDPALNAAQRKRIREETKGRTTVSCIQFGRGGPSNDATRNALHALARDNGGTYTFVDVNAK